MGVVPGVGGFPGVFDVVLNDGRAISLGILLSDSFCSTFRSDADNSTSRSPDDIALKELPP